MNLNITTFCFYEKFKIYFVQLFVLIFLTQNAKAQGNNLQKIIVDVEFGDYMSDKSQLRESMYQTSFTKNPIKFGFSGLMYIYQNVFSEQISASCAYEISCSEFTKLNIRENGLFLGSILGIHQLMHCSHGMVYEVPDYMLSIYSDKIANSVF